MLTKYFVKMQNKMQDMMKGEEGQGLVEYALILVLVAIVVIATLTYLGGNVDKVFSKIAGTITTK